MSSRCLNSCLRTLKVAGAGSRRPAASVSRRIPATARYYGQGAALASRPSRDSEAVLQDPQERYQKQRTRKERVDEREDDLGVFGSEQPQSQVESSQRLAGHLNDLFQPLKFPPDLAHRILTHTGHVAAKYGANAGLTFTGRRVMECYLNLFLTGSKELNATHDVSDITERALHPKLLGEQLGTRWNFNKVLQWTPALSRAELEAATDPEAVVRRIGLFKVQGDAVAATLGGIYFQFGGSVAHRVFHTRMLPHLLVRGGLPPAFHEEVATVAKRMGGPMGNLLHPSGKSEPTDAPASSS
ncbi:hypothetical protein D9611_006643 [Ephemerocybe angulata]|uniref:RNase III domain-containing protein n=1 Tax=Ephemerocybe angulata TaxID=980116 RepID=A0A8H5FH13_9AGAR|nr:hypothetical protein D9611_006643 [Tulosesus angulatus]